MITDISLCFNHARLILRRKHFNFKNGLNVVIGPNGSGKSTLLRAVYQCRDCRHEESGLTRYRYFNGETMNPHKAYKYFKGLRGSRIRVRALFSSHGETMRDVLSSYSPQPGDCFILDEPETGQDIHWILRIRQGLDLLVQNGCQVLVASHHPVFWHNAFLIELQRNYRKNVFKIFFNQMKRAS